MTFQPTGGAATCRRAAVRIAALVAALLAVPLLQPPPVAAQSPLASAASTQARATARMSVAPVLRVVPRGPVVVRFRTDPAEGRWVPAERSVQIQCAANVPHTLRVRAASSGASLRGRIEWSRRGEDAWHPLDARPRPVRSGMSPGRRESCAVLRLRWRPEDGRSPSGPAAKVTLDVSLEPAAP